MEISRTEQEYFAAIDVCRTIFFKKLHDYGSSWRILRPSSLTDQLFIKAKRIRTLEETGIRMIDEGVFSEYIGIVNYSIIGLIQLESAPSLAPDMSEENSLNRYDHWVNVAFCLMRDKNHDYDEVWREMRISSYTDLILSKILRVKQLEDIQEESYISEGIDANYLDILNYAVFALIRLMQ